MKAVQINAYGGSEVVEVNVQAPEPQVEAGKIIVTVQAAGVNPSDWKIRQGLFQKWRPLTFPVTLGGDFSGEVVELGQGVTNFKVGDEVYGRAVAGPDASGSFAEFLSVVATQVALKPRYLSHVEAAAVPLAGVSAWQALVDHIALKQGQKILIHGGAGGIGTFAVQIAKHLGAYVMATVGTKDVAYVRELGADEVIDYQQQSFVQLVHDVDAVFDCVGSPVYEQSFSVLRTGGVIVTMHHHEVGKSDGLANRFGVHAIEEQTDVTSERLAKLAALADQGALQVHIDKTFLFGQAKEALAYMEIGQLRGKVVLRVAN